MMKRLAGLRLYALTVLASACHPYPDARIVTIARAPADQDTDLINFKKLTSGTPLPAALADLSCADRADARLAQSAAVQGAWYGFQDLTEQTVAVTTKLLDSRNFERKLTNKTDLLYKVLSDKKPLKLCNQAPAANSLEFIGSRILDATHEAASFYQQLSSSKPNLKLPVLPPIGIALHPQYKKDTKRIDIFLKPDGSKSQIAVQTISTQTDNAAYSPFADDSLSASIYAISVIPQSAEARQAGLYNGKGLWEFPVVLHHEFGHHIFQMLFGDSDVVNFRAYLDYWRQHPTLHSIHGFLQESLGQGPAVIDRDKANFLSSSGSIFASMNEGFADLYAYYSLNQAPDLFNITCFSQTREVASPVMYSGIEKKWTTGLWDETFAAASKTGVEFSSPADMSPVELCSLPVFDDIHVVGALIAHTVDAAFATVAKARSGEPSSATKAGLLMQWIQELRASDEVLELSSKQSLSRILNTALGTALQALGDSSKTEFCAVVRDKFPALLQRWTLKPFEDAQQLVPACATE